ncbi:toxin-antitoxin system HicB family antitoxin [Phascolarctobacterium succinatutens]
MTDFVYMKPRFSGRFVVRVPKTLHRLLAEESEREGISLNQFVNNSLAFAVGQKLAH